MDCVRGLGCLGRVNDNYPSAPAQLVALCQTNFNPPTAVPTHIYRKPADRFRPNMVGIYLPFANMDSTIRTRPLCPGIRVHDGVTPVTPLPRHSRSQG